MTMADTKKVKTPTLDKMRANREDSQKIGEFLDWIQQNGLWVAEKHEHKGTDNEDRPSGCWRIHQCTAICFCRGPHPHYPSRRKGCSCRISVSLVCGFADGEFYPMNLTIEKLLARYFKIDLKKVEEERRALLEAIRA